MKILPTIRETVVGQIEKSELEQEMLCQFFGIPNDDFPDYDWIHDYNARQSLMKNNEHISINTLQAAVDELKAMGATHVQIYPYGDHESYYFTGVKLELVPDEEVREIAKNTLEQTIMRNTVRLKLDEDELENQRQRLEELKNKLEGLKD